VGDAHLLFGDIMLIQVIVTLDHNIEAAEREAIAKHFALIYNGDLDRNKECPYMPNKGDDKYWTIDLNNDWKVKFFNEYQNYSPYGPNQFEVVYRYSREEAVPAITAWALQLAQEFNGSVRVDENGVPNV